MNRWLIVSTVTYVLLLVPWAAVAFGTLMSISILEAGTPLTKVWFRGVIALTVAYPLSVVIALPLAWWAHRTLRTGLARGSLLTPLIVIGVFLIWVLLGFLTG